MTMQQSVRTFDDLRTMDLQEVYEQRKQEVLREFAFRIRLDAADSLGKLKALVFEGAAGLDRWTAAELLDISNRFRLFSASDAEIRLYEESRNTEFRSIPRVREFYLLALNKAGRSAEALAECGRLLAEGGENGLVWGILGDAWSNKMLSAEIFARELEHSEGRISRVATQVKAECARHFPGLNLSAITLERIHSLRRQCLEQAAEAYRRGFERFATPFPGFCWMLRTGDRYADLCAERNATVAGRHSKKSETRTQGYLKKHEAEIARLELFRAVQPALLRISLEMRGGVESLDFWTHAGYLQLYFTGGCPTEDGAFLLARALATLDADFKLEILLRDLSRIRDQFAEIPDGGGRWSPEAVDRSIILERMQTMLSELASGRERFAAWGKTRGSALNEACRGLLEKDIADPVTVFLKRTINFRTITDTLVPQRIQGGIGRVGARLPDLTINRWVQDDLRSLIIEKVLPALSPASG